jgi:hypothetical protein
MTSRRRSRVKALTSFTTEKRKVFKELIKSDQVFGALTNFMKPMEAAKLFLYSDKLSENILNNMKNNKKYTLTIKEKIEKFFINLFFTTKIKKVINDMTIEQLYMTINGKYTDALKNKILFGTEFPPISYSDLHKDFSDDLKLIFLKSMFGKKLIKNIKQFVNNLTDEEIILFINNKFNIENSLYNSIMQTDYPTKINEKEIAKLKNQ